MDLLFSRRSQGCPQGRMGCSCPTKHRGKPPQGRGTEGRWRWPKVLWETGKNKVQACEMKALKIPRKGLGIARATKGGQLGVGGEGWDTPTMALLCPTLLPGTLRLHPGCSPSHSSLESSTGATLCSSHTAGSLPPSSTSAAHAKMPAQGGFGSGCTENRREPFPHPAPLALPS